MYCRKCGTLNNDDASRCISCAEVLQGAIVERIDNNLALAIVVTVLCCLPFGIVAIVQAAQVNAKAQAGDIVGAEECARRAKKWSLWGLALGLVGYIAYGLLALANVVERPPQ